MHRLRIAFGLITAVTIATPHAIAGEARQGQWTGVERVVTVGDVHGAYDELVAILEESDLVDDEFKVRIDAVDEEALTAAVGDLLHPDELDALLAQFEKAQRP